MKYLAALFLMIASIGSAQNDDFFKSMNQPREPFQIISNIYYVGASDIACYLITSDAGHILLDGGFMETAPMILANIEKLGFNPKDIKILLNSQAHLDHAVGLAEIKKRTGAQMIASKEDGKLLESGGKGDSYFGDRFLFPALTVDRIIQDQESVKVGNVVMKAVLTPGHTKGCTTWTLTVHENSKPYEVVFLCGLTILPETNLVKNETYPNIVEDFRTSYQKLKSLPCDIFLGAHGSYFGLNKKDEARKTDQKTNPFVVPGELRKHVEEKEKNFQALFSKQQSN